MIMCIFTNSIIDYYNNYVVDSPYSRITITMYASLLMTGLLNYCYPSLY